MMFLYTLTTHHDIGWVGGAASITGWVLLAVLLVMFLCSLPCVRRSGRFEVFYYSHLLYTVFWLFLHLHAPNFWKWFLVPGLMLCIEMLVRACRSLSSYGKTTVMKGVILPSKVIHLVLKRPPDFDYHPGDYVFLNIPCLARFEWHPFTISSAPEKDEASVEGRVEVGREIKRQRPRSHGHTPRTTPNEGPYTATAVKSRHCAEDGFQRIDDDINSSDLQLKSLDPKSLESIVEGGRLRERESVVLMPRGTQVRDTCAFLDAGRELETLMEEGELDKHHCQDYTSLIIAKNPLTASERRQKKIGFFHRCRTQACVANFCSCLLLVCGRQVRIDGPYGSSSRHIFRAQHAVLIAAGIGVTPFASILQSIMYRYYQARSTCPRCEHCWVEKLPHSIMKLRKVDFIWINRNQQSLEWFVRMLSDLEMEQAMFGDVLERFLDIHIYITSALDITDMKAVGLHMALDLMHRKDKRCLITGLKRRTQPGRPNWDQASNLPKLISVFADIKSQRKGKVTVFYCGPPTLSHILHDHCNRNHFAFRKEIF
ncbi:unnamed protein product [Ixodes hexagonus]